MCLNRELAGEILVLVEVKEFVQANRRREGTVDQQFHIIKENIKFLNSREIGRKTSAALRN